MSSLCCYSMGLYDRKILRLRDDILFNYKRIPSDGNNAKPYPQMSGRWRFHDRTRCLCRKLHPLPPSQNDFFSVPASQPQSIEPPLPSERRMDQHRKPYVPVIPQNRRVTLIENVWLKSLTLCLGNRMPRRLWRSAKSRGNPLRGCMLLRYKTAETLTVYLDKLYITKKISGVVMPLSIRGNDCRRHTKSASHLAEEPKKGVPLNYRDGLGRNILEYPDGHIEITQDVIPPYIQNQMKPCNHD